MKTVKTIARIAIIVILSIALLVTGANIYLRISFSAFFSSAESTMKIPGLNDGFVQQGLAACGDGFLCSGYVSGGASRVYYFDAKERYSTELVCSDGSVYDGHAGGIAINGDYVYIANKRSLDVFNLSDFKNKAKSAVQIGSFPLPVNAAYCTINNGYLFVGSFYRENDEKYDTQDFEKMTTPTGEENYSLILSYRLDSSQKTTYGIKRIPNSAYSARALLQGVCFTTDKMVLSTSWGLSASHLYFYEYAKAEKHSMTIKDEALELNEKINLYYLDSSVLYNTVKAPPMAEEIVYKDGKIYVMSEAASNKYVFGKIVGLGNLYAYTV